MTIKEEEKTEKKSLNFIEEIIEEDLRNGKNEKRVHTRFPPEPNGYLHIGHAKSICLNFGLAKSYNGLCNLRFDDTNPVKEDVEYVDSILEDVKWLGFEWDNQPYYASDYFDQLYAWAVKLVQAGKAYVDDQSAEEISANRGTPTKAGNESPYKNRSIEENLDLFERMKKGEFKDGEKVLRAKIDMSSPNMHMRDPAIYRIKHTDHHRTGNKWCIYPMYDFAHGESDYLEGITHSICTLEFEVHRPLYDWFLDNIIDTTYRPRQIEFARLNLTYTVMSKRKLLTLVEEKYVEGWDDPRIPTISGLRRRGYTPESIRNFAERVGVAKRDNVIDVGLLEFCIREDLNKKVARVMAVLDPLKIVITNYPEGKTELLEIENNPEDESMGKREMPFSREIYIEKSDFMEDPPKKYFRLKPGGEVRLKAGYIIKCEEVVKDENGVIAEVRCTYDPDTKSGSGEMRKVKGTLHWVSAEHAIDSEVRLYDRLFLNEDPEDVPEGLDYKSTINPESLKTVIAKLEPSLADAKPMDKFQFQRMGYFCVDKASTSEKQVYNRTVTLRDSWAKMNK
ncbi:MAG: glutamine--tRNA ligase/YqeY domain fusion protein [Bacteroidetes bacterium]|jgi:glutaminyl-tRNA synthetase|nr:glutamine--tRNA ligase/YqeY domain fusion protein [Bacteroidota bacterium]MBT5529625.1 glutamine--tRNA ligase/YqeY domain fusion protein [Cytophagia bacterium]MBT3424739.1 glutamine--tRNA ligase/YqeY domain fusion protein [Bacteroidota bacterium]MBT3800541.1 glutamine--tRNA ligase/YqeY domain fusion protein [Bacteroidota bacterium]MBT3935989.1 glutamine--tRNA ligase/YqeY domain fusion protein [Bacteroidota bacterium]